MKIIFAISNLLLFPFYRGRIVQDLPKLRQLDGIEVTKTEKLEAGFQVSSSEEEESDDDDDNLDLNDEPYRQSIADSEGMHRFLHVLLPCMSRKRCSTAVKIIHHQCFYTNTTSFYCIIYRCL